MKDTLFSILGELIGVEPEDIKVEDSLRDDLHMNSVDLAELADRLSRENLEVVDLSEIETVEELLDALNLEDL
jgi:acyl carrier protein